METVDMFSCGRVQYSGSERLRYFSRQLLTADDMRTEQEYFREKQRRHNRLLHGAGTVCGLEVMADPEAGPMAVKICPGYALGPLGDEIYAAEPVSLDLVQCARPAPAPCTPAEAQPAMTAGSFDVYVQIRYVELLTRPTRTLPAGCGCDETACEYSRIRDGFEVRCVRNLSAGSTEHSLCEIEKKGPKPPPCLPCPDDPWLVLAKVQLTRDSGGAVTMGNGAIDNTVRRMIYATRQIQSQLISSCC